MLVARLSPVDRNLSVIHEYLVGSARADATLALAVSSATSNANAIALRFTMLVVHLPW